MVLKFSILMIVLVVAIIAGVSVPLLLGMIPREQRMLAEGLRDRATILLDSVAARAAEPVRTGESGYAAVSVFPAETETMEGAVSLTISGPGDPSRPGAPAREDPEDRDYLWATNDPASAGTTVGPARQPVRDPDLAAERVREIARLVNRAAAAALEGLPVTGGTSDQQAQVAATLQEVASDAQHAGSIPAFDPERLQVSYLFYHPLVTADPEGGYFAGMVRLRVSTARVQERVTEAAASLIRTAGLIALAAVAIGIAAAILLASIAIRPIGRLVKAVTKIRDTEDKRALASETIAVRSGDEIGILAQTVNEMTDGLVKSAIAEEQMLLGREIQKQFLPLDAGTRKEKGSTGGVRTPAIDLYAYYEGAATVSGDYFDWQQLDDRYWAVIKCDVSGHGVEAAFIMVEVATLFLRWSREWRARLAASLAAGDPKRLALDYQELQNLDRLVHTINDMIVEREFKEKFAAFMLCLYDTHEGRLTLCPAGDNRLSYYDSSASSIVTRSRLPGGPAPGRLSRAELDEKHIGYPRLPQDLDRGDVLILFTDGFEESSRVFRDAAGKNTSCDAAGLKKHESHLGSHEFGWEYEEFTSPRIVEVFTAFFHKATYRLERHHLPHPETLEFDFSTCSDSLEEAVLALVAVERVFRTYRDPQTGTNDRIRIEAKVDRYLRKHFRQYESWFGVSAVSDPAAEYVDIPNIKEDPQNDDLTIVLLRRPS